MAISQETLKRIVGQKVLNAGLSSDGKTLIIVMEDGAVLSFADGAQRSPSLFDMIFG